MFADKHSSSDTVEIVIGVWVGVVVMAAVIIIALYRTGELLVLFVVCGLERYGRRYLQDELDKNVSTS